MLETLAKVRKFEAAGWIFGTNPFFGKFFQVGLRCGELKRGPFEEADWHEVTYIWLSGPDVLEAEAAPFVGFMVGGEQTINLSIPFGWDARYVLSGRINVKWAGAWRFKCFHQQHDVFSGWVIPSRPLGVNASHVSKVEIDLKINMC